jgi:RNA polymerase sigma-54 factor
MALSQRLELRQSHALVMTPQLMQAIKLLQLSNLDLTAYVENELERNPLLERASDLGDNSAQETPGPDGTSPADAVRAAWTDGDDAAGEGAKADRAGPDLDDGAAVDTDAAASRANADPPERY